MSFHSAQNRYISGYAGGLRHVAGVTIQPFRTPEGRGLRVTGNAIHVQAAAFCGVTAQFGRQEARDGTT
jgi:hypothetical protein